MAAEIVRFVDDGVMPAIRDPRRRWSRILRFFTMGIFALRYSTPKYLNLEAGDDWKQRLWRSLGSARGAVIDVTDMTTHVVGELLLCHRCLGLGRLMFVGDYSKSEADWIDVVRAALGQPGTAEKVRVLIWSRDRRTRQRFRAAAADFVAALPATAPGFCEQARELINFPDGRQSDPDPEDSQLIYTFLFLCASGLFGCAFGVVGLLLFGLFACLPLMWHFLLYFKDCGSNRERVLTFLSLGSAFALPELLVLPTVLALRDAADQMRSSNNLKELAMAVDLYSGTYIDLPAADGNAGKLAISWRVRILPYLIGGEEIARQYRPDEPWDSPHNKQLIEKMPKVFRHPKAGSDIPAGYTHYRVFVTPPNTRGPSAIFRSGQPGLSYNNIRDGASHTILIVEAAEAVPWTQPDELEYSSDKPLPELGGYWKKRFQRGLCGWERQIPLSHDARS